MKLRGVTAIAVCVLALSGASVSHAFSLSFTYLDGDQGITNSSNSLLYNELGVVAAPGSPAGIAGSITTPDRSSTGTFTTSSGSSTQEFYSTFAQLQSGNDGSWTLTASQGGSTSVYQFTPDLSGIPSAEIPSVKILSPTNASSASVSQPTFTWSDTGLINDIYVSLYSPDLSINYGAELPATQTSWTAPAQLPNGVYFFSVQTPLVPQSVPLSEMLVSGPALSFPAAADFNFDPEAYLSFSVVPEPASLGLLAGVSLLTVRRRRR